MMYIVTIVTMKGIGILMHVGEAYDKAHNVHALVQYCTFKYIMYCSSM